MTGSMPGNAASTVETCVFASAPNPVAAPENSFARAVTWAWTSRPMTISQEPVRPSINADTGSAGVPRAREAERDQVYTIDNPQFLFRKTGDNRAISDRIWFRHR